MPLVITDELLRAAGMSESDARVEIACQWFDSDKLSFKNAATLAAVSDLQFEIQLQRRGLPRYRCTEDMLEQDVATLKRLGRW